MRISGRFGGVLLAAAWMTLGAFPLAGQRLMTPNDLGALVAGPPTARIAYGPSPLQFANLRVPRTPGPHPVIVLVHGGCWLSQYDIAHLGKLEQALADSGFAVWSIEYRRVGNEGGGWPGTFADVALGADHLRRVAAQYQLDLTRVIAAGHSAGGAFALWLAARGKIAPTSELHVKDPLRVRAVFALAPAPDLEQLREAKVCGGVIDKLMGAPSAHADRYAAASAMQLAPVGVPQTLMIGVKDEGFGPSGRAYYLRARGRRLDRANDRAAGVGSLRDDRPWVVELARGVSGAQGDVHGAETIGASSAARLRLAANAAAAFAAVLFGASVVAVRIAVRDVPPLSLAFLRFGQGALVLLVGLAMFRRDLLRVAWRDLPYLALLGIIFYAIFPATFNAGMQYVDASRGGILLATMPLFTVVLARRATGERLLPRQVIGVLTSFAGVAVIMAEASSGRGASAGSMRGNVLLLATALCGAIYNVLAKRVLTRYSGLTVTVYAMTFGALCLAPATAVESLSNVGALRGGTLEATIFLGLFGGALAFSLWTMALARLSPTEASVYINLNPIAAALLGALLLHEHLSVLFGFGFAAVAGGVMVVNWSRRGAR